MIRKILVQDIVSKRSAKNSKDTKDADTESRTMSARERDFLIERLTRKHTIETSPKNVAKVATKPARATPRRKTPSTSRFNHKWLWFSLPLVIIVIILLVLQFFSGAIVTVTPKHLTVATSTSFIASSDATTTSGTITYQVINLSATDSQVVDSIGNVTTTPKKASGQIVIFNKYSTAAQTLVTNTRFETTDGLVYRTTEMMQIPGINSAGVPGSVTVNVVADQTGPKYNIGLVDFTIPGFKADQGRYTKIFGRSKTAMTGGTGTSTIGISDKARQIAESEIETSLKEQLIKQVQAEKTADSVIFNTASKFSFQMLPDKAGADAGHAVISQQGTISAVVFDKKTIGKLLLPDAISKVGGSAEVRGIESLRFVSDVATSTTIWPNKSFNFTLSGSLDVIGLFDEAKLAQDIKGISRSDLPSVIAHYNTIDKVNVVLRPFWKKSFPTDVSKIKVETAK